MSRSGVENVAYIDRLAAFGLLLGEPFKGAKIHHKLICSICTHEWVATPISKLQSNKKYGGNGCPNCTNLKKLSKKEVIRARVKDRIQNRGFEILSDYDGQQTTQNKILVKNINCGHTFESAPGNLLHNDVMCPVCNTIRKRENFKKWSNERRDDYRSTASEWLRYKMMVYATTRHNYTHHKYAINPRNLPSGRAGTKGAYHLDHIVAVRYCFDNKIPADICAHPQNLQMIPWEANLAQKDKLKAIIPPIFHKYIESNIIEQKFVDTMKDHLGALVTPHSNILYPYHDTLWIEGANTVVIFCSIQQYLEQNTNNRKILTDILSYANNKHINCIFVYEDEWFKNPSLVLTKIRHLCHMSVIYSVIPARKCDIRIITDKKEKSIFLNDNHIQGNDNAQITLGAYYSDVLIAIMTFAKPRVIMGSTIVEGHWELSRFATNNNTRVPGIAGKLLKYFTRNYKWNTIYSYADRRWSTGKLYTMLGFVEVTINPPEYYYIKDGMRMHRWNFRKDVIRHSLPVYDDTLTEYQNMLNNGYDRVWGAGTLRYELFNIKKPS
jgi:hypothetical protein